MNFINGILAFGAIAFTVPLIIHLLFKSRFKTVDWGAMHLLEDVVRVNRRRLQVSNLLLLLLRCLIPAVLAFLLARPVLTGFKTMPGDAPESLILVIDDSRSMDAGEAGKPTRLDKAKQDLSELLLGMTRRDEVILVRGSTIDSPPATMGVKEAVRNLKELDAEGGPVDLGRLLDAGASAAVDATNQQRRIVIVSDFQNKMLNSGSAKTLDQIAENFAQQESSPVVSFWDFGAGDVELPNVSVDAVMIDSPAVVAGRSTQYSARIQNASDVPANDLRVVWSINGRPLEPRLISTPPRSSVTSRLNHAVDDPGVYEVSVTVEHSDSLLSDNQRSTAVYAMREINVLLVDGDPSQEPLEGEVDFLGIALSPFAFGGDDQPDAVRTSTTFVSGIERSLEQDTPEIIVLANCRRLQKQQQAVLTDFVLGGGALVVFDGDQINVDDYNQTWSSEAGSIRMPAVLQDVIGNPEPSDDVAPMSVGELNPNFAAWELLQDDELRALPGVEVRAYRKLSVEENEVAAEQESGGESTVSTVLLRMSSGDPLVVSRKQGRGQVIQFAIPANHAWTTLPLQPLYLPMMQQLVLDLAGKGKAQASEVGLPMMIPFSEFDALAKDLESKPESSQKQPSAKSSFTVQLPNGDELAVPAAASEEEMLVWYQTQNAGTYRFRKNSDDDSSDGNLDAATTIRIADVPPSESRLVHLEDEQLNAAAKSVEANIYTSVAEIQADDRTRRFGREIWRWLLWALLIFLVGELLVQQMLVRSTIPKGASS